MGYGSWLHGEAVGAGMVLAADLSHRVGLVDTGVPARLRAAVAAAGLPVRAPAWPLQRWIELMSVDKKARAGVPRFVLLERLGAARLAKVSDDALTRTLAACAA
jgi:3-dehydroquinate synthase